MDNVGSFLCFFVCGEKLCKSFASLFRFRSKVTNLEFVKSCCGKLRCGHAVVTSVVHCGQYHQLSITLASAQHWRVLAMSEDDAEALFCQEIELKSYFFVCQKITLKPC